jgi:hypothetical protein
VGCIYADRNLETEMDNIKNWSMLGSLLFTDKGPGQTDLVKSLLFGVAVGDTLGVPVEFMDREDLR